MLNSLKSSIETNTLERRSKFFTALLVFLVFTLIVCVVSVANLMMQHLANPEKYEFFFALGVCFLVIWYESGLVLYVFLMRDRLFRFKWEKLDLFDSVANTLVAVKMMEYLLPSRKVSRFEFSNGVLQKVVHGLDLKNVEISTGYNEIVITFNYFDYEQGRFVFEARDLRRIGFCSSAVIIPTGNKTTIFAPSNLLK